MIFRHHFQDRCGFFLSIHGTGTAAKINVLQTMWEMITGLKSPKRQYNNPQNAPATPAAPMSIKLKDQM